MAEGCECPPLSRRGRDSAPGRGPRGRSRARPHGRSRERGSLPGGSSSLGAGRRSPQSASPGRLSLTQRRTAAKHGDGGAERELLVAEQQHPSREAPKSPPTRIKPQTTNDTQNMWMIRGPESRNGHLSMRARPPREPLRGPERVFASRGGCLKNRHPPPSLAPILGSKAPSDASSSAYLPFPTAHAP